MSKEFDRTGLRKLIGKSLEYEGTVESIKDKKVLLVGVSLLGKRKILAEHMWVDLPDSVSFTISDKVSFTGIAGSYIDKFGIRKYNVVRVHKLHIYDKEKEHELAKNIRDNQFSRKRKRYN